MERAFLANSEGSGDIMSSDVEWHSDSVSDMMDRSLTILECGNGMGDTY